MIAKGTVNLRLLMCLVLKCKGPYTTRIPADVLVYLFLVSIRVCQSLTGFGEQGNKQKMSQGTKQSEPVLGNAGTTELLEIC